MNKVNALVLTISAAALLFVLSGFQNGPQKFGVVDLSAVAEKSKLGQREKQNFDATRTKLMGLLQFVRTNKVMKREDLLKLVEVWQAEKPTPEQTQQLETIKTNAQKNSDELRRLISIINPTPEQQKSINEFSALAQTTEDLLESLDSMLGQRMQQQASAKQQDVLDKARLATEKVGKRDGYTLILEKGTAPFGTNDITDAAVKVMDTDNP